MSGRTSVGTVARQQAQGLAVFVLCLALSSGALGGLHALVAEPAQAVELAVLVVANLGATVLRFLLLRGWVFRRRSGVRHSLVVAGVDTRRNARLPVPTKGGR